MVVASMQSWFYWALLSAVFASLTAIFAKIGLDGVDSDFATLIRTMVILCAIAWFVYYTGKWRDLSSLSSKNWSFLTLSGLATGASWLCYFRALQMGEAAKVAPVDKLSVVLVAIFAVMFLDERPALKDWFGIFFVGVGVGRKFRVLSTDVAIIVGLGVATPAVGAGVTGATVATTFLG